MSSLRPSASRTVPCYRPARCATPTAGVDALGARRGRRPGRRALPCCGVRGVLPRRPRPLRGARRDAPGDLPGAGRSLRALRVEAVLRGAAPGRRSPVARRRHHTRSAAPTGRARRPDDGGSGVARSAGRPANRGRGRRRAGPDPRAGAGAGSRAAGTPAHPRADHAGRAGQGTRRAAGTVGRRCLLRSRRGRLRDGRRPRVPVRRRGPRRRVRSALGARSADREARVRELHRPGHGALATASRLPHLPLRRLRDDRRQAPDEPLRHPRGRGGPAAARRRVRRPAPRGATGTAGLRRALFDQEAGAVLRFSPAGSSLRPRRGRSSGSKRPWSRATPTARRTGCATRSGATTATTACRRYGSPNGWRRAATNCRLEPDSRSRGRRSGTANATRSGSRRPRSRRSSRRSPPGCRSTTPS